MTDTEEEKVQQLLFDVQLDQFYRQIQDKLHITRLSHFDHVKEEDLDDLGMAKPEQRRLFEALKKSKKKNLFSSFRRKKSKKVAKEENSIPDKSKCQYGVAGESLTCVINEKSLVLHEMLGNGAFGYVRRGEWTKEPDDKIDVAVKCFKYSDDKELLKIQMDFIKEANGMTLIDHPHIIQLYGIVLSTPLMLVTELAPLGCLLHQLRQHPHNFTISTLYEFMVQIASGMAYLESQRFIHRDIAARNLLLESFTKVKIGDFGMMHVLTGDEDYYTMHPTGKVAFAWCPPEVLKLRKFSHASDVWAFGIMVTELFSYGGEPWPGLNGAEILGRVDTPSSQRPARPDHCPTAVYTVLTQQCWAHRACDRPRFSALKKTLEQMRPVDSKAIFSYDSRSPQNLSFQERDTITVLEASPEDSWWIGQNMRTRKVGLFPAELVDSNVKTGGSPSKRMFGSQSLKKNVKQQRPSVSGKLSNCDCGSQHIYDFPVIFSSVNTEDSADCRSTRSLSCESDFTSSTECDSGYCSIAESRLSSTSTDERTSSLSLSYGSQTDSTYELMHPVECASNPIPIPQQNGQQPYDARRARCNAIPSTRRESGKCPLTFPDKLSPADSVDASLNGYPNILPPSGPSPGLTPNSKAPCGSLLSPALNSNGVPLKSHSFLGGKTSPTQFGQGEDLTTSPENAKGDSEAPKAREGPSDVYEDMTVVRSVLSASHETASSKVPSVSADVATSKSGMKPQLSGRHGEDMYEDMALVRANSVPEKSSSSKQRHIGERIYENHSFDEKDGSLPATGRLASAYENFSPVAESNRNGTDTGNRSPPAAYDNHKLKPVGEPSEPSGAYDNHRLRRTVSPQTLPPANYDNWKLNNTVPDQTQQLQTVANSVDERHLATSRHENDQRFEVREPNKQEKTNNEAAAMSLNYENVPAHKEDVGDSAVDLARHPSGSRGAVYENCVPLVHEKTTSSDSSRVPDVSVLGHDQWPRSLPPDLRCIDILPRDSDGSVVLMLNERNVIETRRAGSMDSILFSEGPEEHPIPPPRRKRMLRKCELADELARSITKKLSATGKPILGQQNGSINEVTEESQIFPATCEMNQEGFGSPTIKCPLLVEEGGQAAVNAYENVTMKSKHEVIALQGTGSPVNGLQNNGFSQMHDLPPEIPPKVGSAEGTFHRCKSVAFPLHCREQSVESNNLPMTRCYSEGQNSRGLIHREPLYVNSSEFGYRSESNVEDKVDMTTAVTDVPPPLPRKMRGASVKTAPAVPPRIDLLGNL